MPTTMVRFADSLPSSKDVLRELGIRLKKVDRNRMFCGDLKISDIVSGLTRLSTTTTESLSGDIVREAAERLEGAACRRGGANDEPTVSERPFKRQKVQSKG